MMINPANAFYTDMDENHWAYQSIKFLTEVGVVVGYPDGTYKPDIPVTRAEFAKILVFSKFIVPHSSKMDLS